jgi:hypothetical protein
LSISLLIMFDTLLLRPSLHCNTPLHFTTLHYTSLDYTQVHFTTLIDTSIPLIYTSLPFHIAYSFFNLGARWGCVVNTMPRPLYPRDWNGTHPRGAWVGPRAGLVGRRKSHLHQDNINDKLHKLQLVLVTFRVIKCTKHSTLLLSLWHITPIVLQNSQT